MKGLIDLGYDSLHQRVLLFARQERHRRVVSVSLQQELLVERDECPGVGTSKKSHKKNYAPRRSENVSNEKKIVQVESTMG